MTGAMQMGLGGFSHTRKQQEPERPRERLRGYLEARYRGRPGTLAQEVGIGPKAAENLLLGHWPQDVTLAALMRRFGRDLRDCLFEPDIQPVLARLTAEERRLQEALDAVRSRRLQAQGVDDGGANSGPSVEAERDTLTLDLFDGEGL